MNWINIAAVAASAVVLGVLMLVLVRRWCYHPRRNDFVVDAGSALSRASSIEAGIARLHHQDLESKRSRPANGSYYVFRHGTSMKKPPSPVGLFNWADYPSLITDAVENGWAQFAFRRAHLSSPSSRSALLGFCAAGERDNQVEMGWEMCPGSTEFVQKIRLNAGLKKAPFGGASMAALSAVSVIRAGLPLPGPPFANSSFPQEAYFEITVLGNEGEEEGAKKKNAEGERTKLIQENGNLKAGSIRGNNTLEVVKMEEGGAVEPVQLSLGLTAGASLPLKLPGSYTGSIGFNSTGSVFLDGVKLAFESEMAEWGQPNTIIGCGYNPSQKKVFFTINSEVVRVIHCKSEEFGTPLFPTLAANADISVLVNFGQNSFKYGPANAERTPNPCFTGPFTNNRTAALGFEDSKELFSMGRIDAQWLYRSTTTKSSQYSHSHSHNHRSTSDFDQDSEADLFEIVLESAEDSANSKS